MEYSIVREVFIRISMLWNVYFEAAEAWHSDANNANEKADGKALKAPIWLYRKPSIFRFCKSMWLQLPIYIILGTVSEIQVKIFIPNNGPCIQLPIEYLHVMVCIYFFGKCCHMFKFPLNFLKLNWLYKLKWVCVFL